MSEFEKNLTEYIDDLKNPDPKIRIEAANKLGEWGNDRAVTPLIEVLTHEDENLRRVAASALKEIGNKRALEPLLDLLKKDSSPEVRAEAAYCLGYFQEASNEIDALLVALEDGNYLVRQNAAFAAGKLGRRKSVSNLILLLEKDENYNVKEMAAWALGEIGDKRASDTLIHTLSDLNSDVRRTAAYALGRLGDSKAIDMLKKQLARTGEVKEPAWALTKIMKTKPAILLLRDTFKKKRKEKSLEDCIELTKIVIELDRKTAENMKNEMLSDDAFRKYHDEISEIV
ncbi:MAG: HEAT repeat domain-containing protein [Candidatus Thorarchaeota archaeon]